LKIKIILTEAALLTLNIKRSGYKLRNNVGKLQTSQG